jgi:hypothetical protein
MRIVNIYYSTNLWVDRSYHGNGRRSKEDEQEQLMYISLYNMYMMLRRSSLRIRIVKNDMSRKDNKFISFIIRKKRMRVTT